MRKSLLIIVLCFSFTGIVNAKYVQTCKVKYQKKYGWSDYYTVQVTFMSGNELNKATKTFNYDAFSTYGIIFWDNDEASVIKISSFTGCGMEVSQRCIENVVLNLEGKDQEKRNWEICTKRYCY